MTTVSSTTASAVIPDPRLPLASPKTIPSRCCWPEVLIIALAAVLHAVVIWKAEPLQSANDRSRWCTVRSLLEDDTYRIDRVRQIPGWDTIDLIKRDGHFYSTKPPLMATWVAAVTGVVCSVTGWTFARNLADINGTTLLIINGLPFIAGLAGLAWWLRRTMMSRETTLFVLTAAAFGTLLSPFLTSLNNHTPAAMGVLVALLCWWCPVALSPLANTVRYFIWGFAACWAACHDLPAAAFTAVMGLLALRENWRLTLLAAFPGVLIPAAAFLLCNYWALGSFTPAYSGYGSETYRFLHAGVPSYWLNPQGIDRNLDSPLVYFLNCTIGHHGWFLLTPLWLLVLTGGCCTVRQVSARGQQLLVMTAGLSVIVLGFYLTRTDNYNYGGVSCALRWALFLTPLWLMSLAVVFDRWPASRFITIAAVLLLTGSVYSAWLPMSRAWQQPWAYQFMANRGWLPAAHGRPPQLDHTLYSWFPRIPTERGDSVTFTRQDLLTGPQTIKLTFVEDRTVAQRICAVIALETRSGSEAGTERRELLIDRAAFKAGETPAKCLVWIDPDITPAQQQADLTFFRGLPHLKPYNPGYERYLHLPLRTDAFACQRAAVQYEIKDDAGRELLRYRCDIWISPEIPFGTAQVEWTVFRVRTGELLQRETWTVTDCSPRPATETPVTVEMFDRPEPITRQIDPHAGQRAE